MSEVRIPASVRFIHWSVALLIVFNLYVFEHGKTFHQYAGYVCVGLVLARIVFGQFLYDKRFSFKRFELRFSKFIKFIQGLLKGEKEDFKGHNPVASYVYLSIWTIVCFMGVSGFLMKEIDALWGNEALENIHETMANVLIVFVILHLIGVAQDSYHFKRKTWKRMLTGKDS